MNNKNNSLKMNTSLNKTWFICNPQKQKQSLRMHIKNIGDKTSSNLVDISKVTKTLPWKSNIFIKLLGFSFFFLILDKALKQFTVYLQLLLQDFTL